MTADELRKARESRAAEALKMKDDQIAMLSLQNSKLLAAFNKVKCSSFTLSEFIIY